ncbi:MAG: hypothetical protein H6622_11530 [Halobacteriovoraceae bacterium]|nr:hypothetical protein [Halobacteriovoraceae bacterium]
MFIILRVLTLFIISFGQIFASSELKKNPVYISFSENSSEVGYIPNDLNQEIVPFILEDKTSLKNINSDYFLEFSEQSFDNLVNSYTKQITNPHVVYLYYNSYPLPVPRPFNVFLSGRRDIRNLMIDSYRAKGRILIGVVALGRESGLIPKDYFFDFENNKMLEVMEFKGQVGLISLRRGIISENSQRIKKMHLWIQNKLTKKRTKILTFHPHIISEVIDVGWKLDFRFKPPYQIMMNEIFKEYLLKYKYHYNPDQKLRDNYRINHLNFGLEFEFSEDELPGFTLPLSRKFLDETTPPKGFLSKCFKYFLPNKKRGPLE